MVQTSRKRSVGIEIIQQPAPSRKETKAERFKRIANFRATNALKAIQLLEQLGNREVYGHDQGQRVRLVNTLRDAVDRVEKALDTGGKVVINLFD